ncbi:MaoC family dehydratase N-terminal domain-containing protein [Microbacterium album]|uniref:Acyl-CoA dehydrogenase n=1 Tax=Microbacterium album TaxID=2053191 RepID=A0A917IGA1_9MICO|nr:MaoC family dehydratase N-terminal domain-containing protein [Microbacterium album]GGH47007.1 acyl-CoA dehydrogenase [Microbacterium album]
MVAEPAGPEAGVTREQRLEPFPAEAYRGTFAPDDESAAPGAALPPGWEGVYFPYDAPLADLREDGSPARDGVLPEFDLPRRMYAGEDAVYHRPLRIGDVVEQTARAGSVVEKTGRSGRLVFADVVREFRVGGELAAESVWHDVFLEGGSGGAAGPAPADVPDGAWAEPLTLDERQLFRFSALTFNTHRVHYDLAWAREREGLDGLLVHGPLIRILLLDAVRRHEIGARISAFRFRARAPFLVGTTATIRGWRDGEQTRVALVDADGGLLAQGDVSWA